MSIVGTDTCTAHSQIPITRIPHLPGVAWGFHPASEVGRIEFEAVLSSDDPPDAPVRLHGNRRCSVVACCGLVKANDEKQQRNRKQEQRALHKASVGPGRSRWQAWSVAVSGFGFLSFGLDSRPSARFRCPALDRSP